MRNVRGRRWGGGAIAALAVGAAGLAGAGAAQAAMQFPRMDRGLVERAGSIYVTGGPQFEVDAANIATGVQGTSWFGCPGQGKAKPALVVQLMDLAPGDAQVYAALQVRPFRGTGEDADLWATRPDDTAVCQGILERAAAAGVDPATQTAMGIARAGVDLKRWELMPALPMAPGDTFFGLTTDATGAPWVKTGPSARDLAGAPFTRWDEATGAWVPGADAPGIVATTVWPPPRNHQVMWLAGTTGLDITSATANDLTTVRWIARSDADGTTTRYRPRVDYRARVMGTGFDDPNCRLPGTVRVRGLAGITAASSDGGVLIGDSVTGVRMRCLDRRRTVTALVRWRPMRSTDGGRTWRPWSIPSNMNTPLWIDAGSTYGTSQRRACDTDQSLRRWKGAGASLTGGSSFVGCAPGFIVY